MRFANHFRDRQPQKMSYVVKSSVCLTHFEVYKEMMEVPMLMSYINIIMRITMQYIHCMDVYGTESVRRQSFHWGKMAAHSFICEFIYIEVKFLQMPGFNTVIEIRSATAQPGLNESIDTDASGPTKVQEKLRWGEMQPL